MLVYIDLGKRFFFDVDIMFEFFFDVDIMLGNQKKIEEIYRNYFLNYNLDEKFKSGKITCITASKILEYILKKLGIKIETKTYDEQDNKFAHTYNVIYPSDRGESYKIDLQNDLKNIQFHTMTKNFGVSTIDNNYVIPLHRQKEIHEKIGYISSKNPYTEEYVYLIKSHIILMDNIYDKLEFVLENIELEPSSNIKYWERAWRHKKIMDCVFTKEEMIKLKSQLHGVKCYKREDEYERIYMNCFYINIKGTNYVFLYDMEEYRYKKYTIEEFAQKIQEEKIEISQETKIPGLNEIINQTNNNNHHK